MPVTDPSVPIPSALTNNVVAFNPARSVFLTGSVAETILGTITLKPGALGPNGLLRLTTLWNVTNNGNVKTARVRAGGIGGTDFASAFSLAAFSSALLTTYIFNSVSGNQLGGTLANLNISSSAASFVTVGAALPVGQQDIVITGQLANGADLMILEFYLAEIFRF